MEMASLGKNAKCFLIVTEATKITSADDITFCH